MDDLPLRDVKTDGMESTELKPRAKLHAGTLLACVLMLLLVGGFAAWRYYAAPPLQRYDPLLAKISQHAIACDDGGRIDLSKDYHGLTPRDQAFVQYRDDGSYLAMFPTYCGQASQVAGLMYTSRPLQDDDTSPRDDTRLSERLIKVGTYGKLVIDKEVNPNWYYVSYHLH